MDIAVRKASQTDQDRMAGEPVWGCKASTFEWFYDEQETCLLLEGKVTVEYQGKSVTIEAGDYVVFPKGLACVWTVQQAVKKHYFFG